jgi:uncharacterized protein YciI
MLYLVRYTMLPGAERAHDVYPRHRAYLDEFARGGDVVLIGPILPVPTTGARF